MWQGDGTVHGGEDVASVLHQEVRLWALDCGGQVQVGGWGCVGRGWAGRSAELCLCLELLLPYNAVAYWVG